MFTEPIMSINEVSDKLSNREFICNGIPYEFYGSNKIRQQFPIEMKNPEEVASYTIENGENYRVIININKLKSSNLPDQLLFVFGFMPENTDIGKCIILSKV